MIQSETNTPSIGSELIDIDLSRTLSDAEVTELRHLFLQRLALVFRNQKLDRNQHKAFARLFGDIHIYPSYRSNMNKGPDPEIFLIDTPPDAKQSNGELWHSDVSCEPIPPMASLLYVTKVPDNGGGDTMFANMYDAFEELSDDIKQILSDKKALHDGEVDLRNYGIRLRPGQTYPTATYPVVVAHPETKRPVLFVNHSFTSHIEGIPRWESDLLMGGLHERVALNARAQCRVRWQPGTLVMWDNRCAQHQAIHDYAGFARYGERVSIMDGLAPVQALV